MKVNILTLCDFAQDNNGKLTIVGVFDSIVAPKVPLIKSMFYVARICFTPDDSEKKHKIKVSIIDEKKQTLLINPIVNDIQVDASKNNVSCNLIFELGNFTLPSEGIYNFKLEIDDVVQSISLNVRLQK